MKDVASVCQAGIEEVGDELLVEVLANEDELLHAVAEMVVPVTAEAGILLHELLEFVLRHGGVPLAGIADADLFTSLLKDVANIAFVLEVADTLGADDALGPLAGHELVEESQIEGTATIVDIGADSVFLSLALIVVMVVVMVLVAMMVFVLMMMFVVVVMVMMLMLVVMVMMFMLVVVIVIIVVVILIVMLLHFLNPSGRSCYSVEVEHIGIQYLIEINVAVVTVDNLSLGLKGTDDFSDAAQFLRADLGGLVQEHDVAEFNLLDDEVLNILLVDVLAGEVETAAELVSHAEGIDDGYDAVE